MKLKMVKKRYKQTKEHAISKATTIPMIIAVAEEGEIILELNSKLNYGRYRNE